MIPAPLLLLTLILTLGISYACFRQSIRPETVIVGRRTIIGRLIGPQLAVVVGESPTYPIQYGRKSFGLLSIVIRVAERALGVRTSRIVNSTFFLQR